MEGAPELSVIGPADTRAGAPIGKHGGHGPHPEPDPATMAPETSELLAKLPPLNLSRMLAGGEGMLRAFVRFGNHLLHKTQLDPVLREIAIVRVGVLSDASYDVHQHDAISRSIGMSDVLIQAIRAGADDPAFDDLQRLVVCYTDDVVASVRASDPTFDLAERCRCRSCRGGRSRSASTWPYRGTSRRLASTSRTRRLRST